MHVFGAQLVLVGLSFANVEGAGEQEQREGLSFAGLPLVNYNSDEGVGYGARVALYDYGSGQRPYRYALTLQFFQTTTLVMYHRIIFDAPKFLDSPWRIDGEIRLFAEKFAPYYGLGNRSRYDSTRELSYYSYDVKTPQLLLNVRRDLRGPWKLFGGYFFQYTFLDTSP